MILNGLTALTDFAAANAPAKKPLEAWQTLISKNSFKHYIELKNTFGAADYSAPYTIFDVGGNKFRIIALVSYETQVVYVKFVMTHSQYDGWCKTRAKTKGKKK